MGEKKRFPSHPGTPSEPVKGKPVLIEITEGMACVMPCYCATVRITGLGYGEGSAPFPRSTLAAPQCARLHS